MTTTASSGTSPVNSGSVADPLTLEESYRLCGESARRAARNFYYSFWVLPAAKRRAMCALYAFFRRTDDLGDSDRPTDERRAALKEWRASFRRAVAGAGDDPLLPALVDTIRRYAIPTEYFETTIDGVESDLDRRQFATTAELEHYCYQVASVVGLACIHVWGFQAAPQAYEAARQCGIAFQLTNIIRDIREDAVSGRVYLPLDDLQRFDLTSETLLAGTFDRRARALVRYEADRAEEHYAAARELMPYLSREGRRAYAVMFDIYHALLAKIRRRDYDVFSQRVRLSPWHKGALALRRVWPRFVPFLGRERSAASDTP